ncbi:SusC/RagA family TonB-linked outer membrane protein [Mucilaginibacter sp.]
MKKILPLILMMPCIAMGASSHPNAYSKAKFTVTSVSRNVINQAPVSGVVKDETGQALPGVSVTIKGTTKGTRTDANGAFSLNVAPGDVLVFSYVGYVKQEVTVGSQTEYVISLVPNPNSLNEVVVTALGVKKSEKSLVYANQVVSGDELTNVKTDNLMNSLNGKVAGVDISPSSSGVGGSVKVILRGSKSATGTNQPLYVIDGVPMTNTSNANGQPTGTYGGSPDGGDGISNLNPEDIESITVLEGASAAALYGSQAANGVVLVTTKKGKAGQTSINLSSSYTNDAVSYEPKFQNEYGPAAGSDESWGAKLASPVTENNLSDFFRHGDNLTNSINFSSGSELAQTYFSYANTTANGVEPGDNLQRNNFTFRETGHFLNNKLTVDVNTNYVNQKIVDAPGEGFYYNALTGLYLFPRGESILPYKENYAVPEPGRNGLLTQNWDANEDVQQNPWWITNNNPNYANRDRLIVNSTVRYEVNNWLNFQVRGNVDRVADTFEQDLYAGTNAVLTPGVNGSFTRSQQTLTQMYSDFIANFKVPIKGAFKLDGLVGASITDDNTVGNSFGSGLGLSIPNVFIEQNVVTSSGTSSANSNVLTLPNNHNQVQSIFGSVNLSFKNWAYLTVTERNDWSSTLAFTPNESYSYPSVGLSVILNEALKLPDVISYAKIRGSYAEVATPVTQYITNPINYLGSGGSINFNSVYPNPTLKPTNTKSKEAGLDLRLFNNRLSYNFTWYKSNSYNQFIQYTPEASTGYSTGYLNAGNIQNSGIEMRLGYDIVKSSDFSWNTNLNYSFNKNKIIELNPSAPTTPVVLTGFGNNAYESVLVTGGQYGDIYGYKFQRSATGQIEVGTTGAPIANTTPQLLGNPNPKFQLGWGNTFNYKRFSLDFLVDGKFGGQVLSMTQMLLDSYGVSAASGAARDAGGVTINGVNPTGQAVTKVDAQTYYSAVGGRSGIGEAYMYSATVVRLRSASLSYSVPISKSVIKSVKFSIIGGNLIYFYKKAPYDPEITMSTSNGLAGVDVFNAPTTRNVGASFTASF